MSKAAIEGLQPEILWNRFYEIAQVPRPSKKEEKIRKYLRDVATEHNLEFSEDDAGNIVMHVPATPGYENSPVIILQGHVDMVCEKNKGTEHDFDNDPIKLKRDGDWITADGTTLGSDNGIGVAAGLAVITDKSFNHGPVELLMTIDEETGLTGVENLKPDFVTGRTLLNLDSEEDGAFYVGCSGGIDTQGILKIDYKDTPADVQAFTLQVSGLKGGHSGLDIHQGRGNAIKILARVLKKLEGAGVLLGHIEGGSKRNAIPREAEALILVKPSKIRKASKITAESEAAVKAEFRTIEPGLKVSITEAKEVPAKMFSKKFSRKLVNVLLGLPHGVAAMSADIPGLVETSSNLATITCSNGEIVIGTSQRSSIESAKRYIADSVLSVLDLAGAELKQGDGYPGWKPDMDSRILKLSAGIYEKMFNAKPEIKAIHAGLECGILKNKYPKMDMVSFGPTIEGAHSPDERVNIPAVEKFYKLLTQILTEFAGKSK